MLNKAIEVHTQILYKNLKPPERLTVSDWADKYRILTTKSSAEPGRWKTSRTPYLREIMDCLSEDSLIEEVVFMKGAQVGGTECGNNWIGYVIDHCPGPMLIIWPTVDMVEKNSKIRIDPLIENCPNLQSKVKEKKTKDSDNTIRMKGFPGGFLAMNGANSAAGLKSLPCRYVFLDEVDEYPGDVSGQGDPVNLAKARAKTFSRKKFFLVSTPTDEYSSRINVAYEESDKRKYHIPCPHCNEYQDLKWAQLKWPKGKPEEVLYYCEHCGEGIEEHHKSKFLAKGKWVAEKPGYRRGKVAGFHLSSLYSPLGWFSWSQAAEEWEQIHKKKNQEMLKTFINTVLGETWKDRGEAPDWERLYERRDLYKINTLPEGVVFLTAGVDVQKDRLEIEICGWGRDKVSWSIDYRVLMGDTAEEAVWNNLTRILSEGWLHYSGSTIGLSMMTIDSGYNTQKVYSYCRKFSFNRVRAVKGFDNQSLIVGTPKAVDVTVNGKTLRNGLKIWSVGVSIIKSEVYGWLNQTKAKDGETDPVGYCHFPEYDEEYFKQMTAEQLTVKLIRGYRRYEWKKIRDRNEALDCRVYNRAAASMLGMDRFKDADWEKMERVHISPIEVIKETPPAQTRKRKQKSSFWDR